MTKHAVLCVDDEINNVDALERLFRTKYQVFKATSAAEGLEILEREKVAVIISDQRMPQMTGVQFLEKSRATHPDAIRILLTGFTDIDSVISAINSGQIYRYVTKPWDSRELLVAVDRAVERFDVGEQLKITNEALKKALEELQTLDKAKTHFMVLINHELKTPLTSLLSFWELLRETKLTKEQNQFLDRIGKSADRLKEIIFDVLELMSAETGQLPVNRQNVDVESTINGLKGDLSSFLESKKQKLQVEVKTKKVQADPQILKSVLKRITHNASRFGDPNSLILVKVTPSHNSGTEFHIENEGPDLKQAEIERILKPFSLNENMMHHSQGLGLGLSLCQALLRRHGSQLHIESGDHRISVSFEL